MPKGTHILFFLATTAVFIVVQLFVFSELRRYIRKYVAENADRLVSIFKWLFIIMNLPVVVMYFRRQIAAEFPAVTNAILYPYTVWVFLLLFWTLILIPIVVIRVLRMNIFKFR